MVLNANQLHPSATTGKPMNHQKKAVDSMTVFRLVRVDVILGINLLNRVLGYLIIGT